MLNLAGYKLTFSDEFNTRSISQTGATTVWSDIRSEWRADAHSDVGFGKSSFMDASSGYDPFQVSGGALTITAVPDRTPYGSTGSWESGLIHTKGEFAQTYGYFEIRADFSNAPAAWDAFWLLPVAPKDTGRAGWQELDVVEHYGNHDAGVYSWIHTTDPSGNPSTERHVYSNNPQITSGFHTYGMMWGPQTISFYVDGELKGTRATPSDMHGPMYLLANLAVETGVQAGAPPMSMAIDYIRVFSADPSAKAVMQGTVSAPDSRDPGLYGATAGAPTGVLTGSDGNDVLMGDGSVTRIVGGSGSDTITASVNQGAKVTIIGGREIGDATDRGDTITIGGRGTALVYGNGGDDTIISRTAGSNVVHAGIGNDTIRIENGVGNWLTGGSGTDTITVTGHGNNTVCGGADIADATDSSDRITITGNGANIVYANGGDDLIVFSGTGSNTVYGGMGNDSITGGAGADLLVAGPGRNIVAGGAGADRFVHTAGGQDIITDFNFAGGDRIALGGQSYGFTRTSDGHAAILVGQDGLIVLQGVAAGSLTADYFV